MDDDREEPEKKPEVTPAPPLSVEFPSCGTAAGLEKIRARLCRRHAGSIDTATPVETDVENEL